MEFITKATIANLRHFNVQGVLNIHLILYLIFLQVSEIKIRVLYSGQPNFAKKYPEHTGLNRIT